MSQWNSSSHKPTNHYLFVAQELKAKYEAIADGDRSSMQDALHGLSKRVWLLCFHTPTSNLTSIYHFEKSMVDVLQSYSLGIIWHHSILRFITKLSQSIDALETKQGAINDVYAQGAVEGYTAEYPFCIGINHSLPRYGYCWGCRKWGSPETYFKGFLLFNIAFLVQIPCWGSQHDTLFQGKRRL